MPISLTLQRKIPDDTTTLGILTVFSDTYEVLFTSETLELSPRNGKGPIHAGAYPLAITYSPAFKRYMPLIMNVPNFEGIRIHYGNTWHDTTGCVLIGFSCGDGDFISGSRLAFDKFFTMLSAEVGENSLHVLITILDPQ